jgi:hypothetical protein
MSRFHLEISEDERFQILVSVAHRIGSADFGYSQYPIYLDLLRRLLEAPKLPEGQASAPKPQPAGMPAAVATARAPEVHNTPPDPPAPERVPVVDALKSAGVVGELTITPVKVEQSQDGKAMVVSYQVRSGQKTRVTKTRCWDPKLFSALLATVGQTTTFLTRESKGFLNIVGVKA